LENATEEKVAEGTQARSTLPMRMLGLRQRNALRKEAGLRSPRA